MIHIAAKVGEGEGMMGVLLALSAIVELPAMSLFPRMRRHLSLRALLRICAAGFVLKDLLFLLAGPPVLLYAAALLQFFEFGIFLPATVYYVAEHLDSANQGKGQGLIHVCSNGLGPAAVTAVGGRLIDGWGVNVFLVFAAACAAAGLLVVITATSRHFEREDSKG